MTQTDLIRFQNKINYKFKDLEILSQALRHSSFVNENLDLNIEDIFRGCRSQPCCRPHPDETLS